MHLNLITTRFIGYVLKRGTNKSINSGTLYVQKTIVLSRAAYLWDKYIVADVRALRDMHIKVPEAVRVGDSVTLACDYDLESAALYTIKWYRYDSEFYRYVPKESPASKVFPTPHLIVDVSIALLCRTSLLTK